MGRKSKNKQSDPLPDGTKRKPVLFVRSGGRTKYVGPPTEKRPGPSAKADTTKGKAKEVVNEDDALESQRKAYFDEADLQEENASEEDFAGELDEAEFDEVQFGSDEDAEMDGSIEDETTL